MRTPKNKSGIIDLILKLRHTKKRNSEAEEEKDETEDNVEEDELPEDNEGGEGEEVVIDISNKDDDSDCPKLDELQAMFESAIALSDRGERCAIYTTIVEYITDEGWGEDDKRIVDSLKKRCRNFLTLWGENGTANTEESITAADDIESLIKSDLGMLKETNTISFTRLLWRATNHWLAWVKVRARVVELIKTRFPMLKAQVPCQVDEPERAYIARVCSLDTQVSRGLCYLFRFFDIDLRTAVGSFRMFDEGDVSDVFSRFGLIAAQLCYYKKNKIVSTVLTTGDTLLHLRDHHRDLFDFTCKVSRVACADEIQEMFNSRYGSICNSPLSRTDDYLKDMSLPHNFIGPIKEEALCVKAKKTSELERRHLRATSDKNKDCLKRVGDFILGEFTAVLNDEEQVQHLNPIDKAKIGMTMAKGVLFEVEHTNNIIYATEKTTTKKTMTIKQFKELITELVKWHNDWEKEKNLPPRALTEKEMGTVSSWNVE